MFGNNLVPSVTAKDLKSVVDNNEEVVLLDVRTREEFDRGSLPGSVNLPVEMVASMIEEAVPDKSRRIYVYCLSGSRSIFAVTAMQRLGYTAVFNVQNGLLDYRALG